MILLSLMSALVGTASAEPVLTHQGRALDPLGVPLQGPVDVQIRLFDEADSPAPFWDKTYEDVVLQQGYYALSLVRDGADTPLDALMLADGETWMDVTIGTSPTSRQLLGSSPNALSVTPVLATAGAACSTVGVLAYEVATNSLLVCDGSTFVSPGVGGGTGGQTGPGSVVAACDDMTTAGNYILQPSSGESFTVWCERGPDDRPMTLVSSYVVPEDGTVQILEVDSESAGTLLDARYQAVLASHGPSELVLAGEYSNGTRYVRSRLLANNCVSHTGSARPLHLGPSERSHYSWSERTGCDGVGSDYSMLIAQGSPSRILVYDGGSYQYIDVWQAGAWVVVPAGALQTLPETITRFSVYVRPLQ